MEFQIYGSGDSEDYDVMVFLKDLPKTNKESHDILDGYDEDLIDIFRENGYIDKVINSNIAVIEDGIMTQVYKGSIEECNNSLYKTYSLHKQIFPLKIEKLVVRDVQLKVIRTARVLLSFFSRSEFRPVIKKALKGDFIEKIEVLSSMDFSKDLFMKKNYDKKTVYKILAFQLAQTIALMDGTELYTKRDMVLYFPDLYDLMDRNYSLEDLKIIEKYKTIYVNRSKLKIPNMTSLFEYKL